MAHFRPRHALEILMPLLKFSPLIGIFGHRQVGKTTFLEKLVSSYVTFDDKETLTNAKRNPEAFLKNLDAKPAGIDECQYVKDLFPALKRSSRDLFFEK